MKLSDKQTKCLLSNLGLDRPFSKGQIISVRNCWHFMTDGNDVDFLFCDETDFMDGMNRVFIVSKSFDVIILAFTLMDTHVHFILYGEFDECNRFMHEFIRRTSQHISSRHGETSKLRDVHIRHQVIDNDQYLKIAICYTIKNAPVGGLPYNALDYPWSSGPLYFRHKGLWSSPLWINEINKAESINQLGVRNGRTVLKSRDVSGEGRMIKGIVFPGEYVAYETVEQLFKSCKAFNFYMGISKEKDVDEKGGVISYLSLPLQEMRQHKTECCQEMFGQKSIKKLDTSKRLMLAKRLKSRYNSSTKQIARLCGLVYDEVKNLL